MGQAVLVVLAVVVVLVATAITRWAGIERCGDYEAAISARASKIGSYYQCAFLQGPGMVALVFAFPTAIAVLALRGFAVIWVYGAVAGILVIDAALLFG